MGSLKRRIIEDNEPTLKEWERRWIPVEESLPECGDFAWVFTPGDGVQLSYWWNGFITADGAGDREGLKSETINPTHWMAVPVPEPPK